MGTLMGHVLPGTFFLAFSLWWMWQLLYRYFLCLRGASLSGHGSNTIGIGFRTSSTFPSRCGCCKKMPVEGMIKVIFALIGITGEFITAFENGRFVHFNNAQHMTMFFFFGMNGVVDILFHLKAPLPPDSDYATAILAFGMEAFLFFFHLHNRSSLDKQLHVTLFLVVVFCAISSALEMKHKRNLLPALARVYFTMLQGTWFYQVGFILYPLDGIQWEQERHKELMIGTLLLACHAAAILVFFFMVGTFIYWRVKLLDRTAVYHKLRPHEWASANGSLSDKSDLEQVRNILDSEEEL